MADLKAKVYNWQGQEVGTETLEAKVFGVPVKANVVQMAVIAQRNNARQSIADTKGRGEVRGGGKKPWKQKGTGRARHGSIRSPLWVGGGITFGPTSNRNFGQKINKKIRKQAMLMALSDKVSSDNLVIFEKYDLAKPKTKSLKAALDKLATKGKSTLIVTAKNDVNMIKSAQNLPKVETIYYGSLNVNDLLGKQYLVISQDLVKKIQEHYRA